MINLIPPEAKKRLRREYWVRVITVWIWSFVVALSIVICVLLPTYVLLSLQIAGNAEMSRTALEKISEFETLNKELEKATEEAQLIVRNATVPTVSSYIETLRRFENQDVRLTKIQVARDGDSFAPIIVSGEATTRQALAAFREELLALPDVASVDLPISNLAKESDIEFSLTITHNK